MNPIPSHESYMRRMAAVTAVGAHRPTDTKRNLGFVIHGMVVVVVVVVSKWEMRASGPLSADVGDPRIRRGEVSVGNHRWSRFRADVARLVKGNPGRRRLLLLIWFVNFKIASIIGNDVYGNACVCMDGYWIKFIRGGGWIVEIRLLTRIYSIFVRIEMRKSRLEDGI